MAKRIRMFLVVALGILLVSPQVSNAGKTVTKTIKFDFITHDEELLKEPDGNMVFKFELPEEREKEGWWKLIKPKIKDYLKKEQEDFEKEYEQIDENTEKEFSRSLEKMKKKGNIESAEAYLMGNIEHEQKLLNKKWKGRLKEIDRDVQAIFEEELKTIIKMKKIHDKRQKKEIMHLAKLVYIPAKGGFTFIKGKVSLLIKTSINSVGAATAAAGGVTVPLIAIPAAKAAIDGLQELHNDYKNIKDTFSQMVNLIQNGTDNNISTIRSATRGIEGMLGDIEESTKNEVSKELLGRSNKKWISMLEKKLAELKAAREDFGTRLFRSVKSFGRGQKRVKNMLKTCKTTAGNLKKAGKEISSGKIDGKSLDAKSKKRLENELKEKIEKFKEFYASTKEIQSETKEGFKALTKYKARFDKSYEVENAAKALIAELSKAKVPGEKFISVLGNALTLCEKVVSEKSIELSLDAAKRIVNIASKAAA